MPKDPKMAAAAARRLGKRGKKPWKQDPAGFNRLADKLEAQGVKDPYHAAAAEMAKKKRN